MSAEKSTIVQILELFCDLDEATVVEWIKDRFFTVGSKFDEPPVKRHYHKRKEKVATMKTGRHMTPEQRQHISEGRKEYLRKKKEAEQSVKVGNTF